MNLRMLLQQIDDIAQRDLYVPILGRHGGGTAAVSGGKNPVPNSPR
jgi:hypothetical protein